MLPRVQRLICCGFSSESSNSKAKSAGTGGEHATNTARNNAIMDDTESLSRRRQADVSGTASKPLVASVLSPQPVQYEPLACQEYAASLNNIGCVESLPQQDELTSMVPALLGSVQEAQRHQNVTLLSSCEFESPFAVPETLAAGTVTDAYKLTGLLLESTNARAAPPPLPPSGICPIIVDPAANLLGSTDGSLKPQPRHRLLNCLAIDNAAISTSLSEPHIPSSSPGSQTPADWQPYTSGSTTTAVTAISGGTSNPAARVVPSAQVLQPAIAAVVMLPFDILGPSPDRSPGFGIAPGAKGRGGRGGGSGTVERSGGSRLGRPEFAVLGPAAGPMAGKKPQVVTEAKDGLEPAAAEMKPATTAATGYGGVVAVDPGGIIAAAVNNPSEVVLKSGWGAIRSSGSNAASALGVLGDMTRRLLSIMQDVGMAVSQVVLLPVASSLSRVEGAEMSRVEGPELLYASSFTAESSSRGVRSRANSSEFTRVRIVETAGEGCGAPQQLDQQAQQQQNILQEQQAQKPSLDKERGVGKMAKAAASVAGDRAGSVSHLQYVPHLAGRASLRAGSDSGTAGATMLRRELVDSRVGQLGVPYPGLSTRRQTRQASRDPSQIALMQLLHFGSTSGRVPLQLLTTLDVNGLSRDIRALRWIGQGGGGAVFQGVWQGALVAVKFMLAARPEHVDATALEAVVGLAVGHPNIVTTYHFDVTRLTEASFLPDAVWAAAGSTTSCRFSQQPMLAAVTNEDSSATELFNALMETETLLEPAWGCAVPPTTHRHRAQHQLQAAAIAPGGSGIGGGSRPASLHRLESLNTRVRRAQAAVAITGGSANATPNSDMWGGGGGPHGRPSQAAAASPSVPPGQRPGAVAPVPDSLGYESAFNSEEGFGNPDLTDSGQSWTVRHVLAYLKARPNMYMTHIIMEYCDRGSLLSAIKRGVFRMEDLQDDDERITSSGRGGPGCSAAAATAAVPSTDASPDLPKFTKRIVLRAILRTARDVAQGMCHLHGHGIIHGDLKPGNVLLRGCRTDRRGFTALVSDFGLSKVTRGDKPLELNHWSTVTVMAPEVIMGSWLKASDVFSFGILLWQLVTGQIMPYGNVTVQQMLIGVAHGVLKPEWPSSAHPALVRLGRACLATSPEKRPSFEAIVKILVKMEQYVRNERRPRRDRAPELWNTVGGGGSRNTGSGVATARLDRLRSSVI